MIFCVRKVWYCTSEEAFKAIEISKFTNYPGTQVGTICNYFGEEKIKEKNQVN
jgi:hypothetical protein